jgi:hypothetical protein
LRFFLGRARVAGFMTIPKALQALGPGGGAGLDIIADLSAGR